MKPKLYIILNIFFSLSLFLFSGCASVKKAYDGPKLQHDQIARIIIDMQPKGIVTDHKHRKLDWFFAKSHTLEVLPGRHSIQFEVVNPPRYIKSKFRTVRKFSYTVTVKAGHIYRIYCSRSKIGRCDISDTTEHEKF